MIFVKGLIRKAWGMKAHTPEHGSTMIRNPPATAFKPPTEEDIPAFAHDGHVVLYPVNGKAASMVSVIGLLL